MKRLALFLLLTLPLSAQQQAKYHEFSALTAGGTTSSHFVGLGARYPVHHTFQAKVASLPDTCAFQLEGCLYDPLDATCWEPVSSSIDCTTTEIAFTPDKPVRYVRGNLTALTGTAATVLAPEEILTENDFATHANWDVTGDFDDTGGNAAYTHATGAGTLTQASADFDVVAVASRQYAFTYTVSSATGDVACDITTAFASVTTSLTVADGVQTTFLASAASPGDFVISCTSTTGGATFDDLTLTRQSCSNESPINVTTSSAHGFSTGFLVTITGAVGNTACNVTDAAITVVDADEFTIDGTTGNGKWTTGGSIVTDPSVTLYYLGVR